ncbi:MAG: DUF167 domain-containing protein [Thermoleophilia bacterium]|nr:DUF167 domain-containing protein [Thermoleophilia bacterium]
MTAAAGSSDGRDQRPVARIRLRVAPGANRSRIVGRHGDGWKVRVDAAPERGRANDRLCTLIASIAGVRSGDVQVVSGASGRDKLVSVHGIELDALSRMLDAASGK